MTSYGGFTLVRLPDGVDPRGRLEQGALSRARVWQAWRRRNDLPDTVPRQRCNVIRFGGAAKS